jgi:hypothetical protein
LEVAAQVLDVELIIAFGWKDLMFNKLMDCLCFGFNSRSCCLSTWGLTLGRFGGGAEGISAILHWATAIRRTHLY